MDSSYNTTIFIILCAIVITTTAASILKEEVVESSGEYGEYDEGDMLLTKEQKNALYNTAVNTRNGLRDITKRWTDAIVVYRFDVNFGKKNETIVKRGMAEIQEKTCVKFRPQKNDKEHAVIIQGKKAGCFSNVGRSSSRAQQVLNLGKNCFGHGTVVHEILHTLGFYHMQSTYNRDDYVTIKWRNIIKGHEHNFKKYNNKTVEDFGELYDYGSVMHYSAKAFGRNGKVTIVTKQKNVTIGQRKGLSEKDALKLNRMYHCKRTSTVQNSDR